MLEDSIDQSVCDVREKRVCVWRGVSCRGVWVESQIFTDADTLPHPSRQAGTAWKPHMPTTTPRHPCPLAFRYAHFSMGVVWIVVPGRASTETPHISDASVRTLVVEESFWTPQDLARRVTLWRLLLRACSLRRTSWTWSLGRAMRSPRRGAGVTRSEFISSAPTSISVDRAPCGMRACV